MRQRLTQSKRWVIKVGSTLLTDEGRGLDHQLIRQWTGQIAALVAQGVEVVLVSSGSIAEGMARLDWQVRPSTVHDLQAAAAVGQMGLVQAYESCFKQHQLPTAQILLTHDDMANRRRYLNARSTLRTLLRHGVIPVVNENDTVTTDEIRFGDNDTLAALVATLIDADTLVLLTDQEGLYDSDPRHNPNARLLERADAADPSIRALAGPSASGLGSGGMLTKVTAAERAAEAGATTIIASGRQENVLLRLKAGETIGTMLTSDQQVRLARKQWLGSMLRVHGTLVLDEGACEGIRHKGASLLSVGVVDSSGDFQRGELVSCIDTHDVEVARGLINYSSDEVARLHRTPSHQIESVLGYSLEPELIHRDNLVVQTQAAANAP